MSFQDESSHHHVLKLRLNVEKFRTRNTKVISTKLDVFFQPKAYPWRLLTPNHLHALLACCPYGPSIVRCQEVRVGEAYRKLEVFRARGRRRGIENEVGRKRNYWARASC
jgi:hypothetical protein